MLGLWETVLTIGDYMEDGFVNYSKITFDIDAEMHRELKSRAALRGITLRKWLMTAIWERLNKEKQYE